MGGTDGNLFTIDERGQFSFKETNPPDFDAPGDVGRDNLYNVTIQARDPESNTASLPVTVTVTEVNEGPVIARQGSAPGSVLENQAQNMVLARYTATDPERPNVKITQWSTSGRDGGDFVIDALGELRFRNAPDHERPADSNRDNVYEVTIRASDGRYTSTLEEIQTVDGDRRQRGAHHHQQQPDLLQPAGEPGLHPVHLPRHRPGGRDGKPGPRRELTGDSSP